MADQTLIDQIKTSVQKCLDMGFAIMICEPHEKKPYAKYSPHAVNSASRIPDVVFQPWNAGEEANYGVACGQSNLCVVDADYGLKSIEEFEAWRIKHNIPETFTVLSGRDGEYLGVHMYFSGTVPTTGFDIGGVTGELKSKGGYVVGPGSLHPSGKPYTIYKDVSVAPLPAGIAELAPEGKKFEAPVAQGGELVPKGSRWKHLQSKTGTFRNAGLDEEGIYNALVNYAINNCEEGDQYVVERDEAIRALAKAGINKFDAMEPAPIVFFGDKDVEIHIPDIPASNIDGDWMGDLAHLLTDGTFIPPSFARAHIKTILGASVDGMVGFSEQPDLHTRHWSILIADPESGKGESWKRVGQKALALYMKKTGLNLEYGEGLGSGEYMVTKLADLGYDNTNVILYYDELANLLVKGNSQNSTLMTKLNQLYEGKNCSTGSLSNKAHEIHNLSLSFTGGIPRSEWENLSGKGAGGSGFLSRCTLSYTDTVKKFSDWPIEDAANINEVAAKMFTRWQEIKTEFSKQNDYTQHPENKENGWRWLIHETPEANLIRNEFYAWLTEKKSLCKKNNTEDCTTRMDSHFKRDFVLRTLFSEDGILTAERMQKSVSWAKHEIMLREELWPVDRGNLVTRMEVTVIRALRKHMSLTQSEAQKFANVTRPETGGVGTFNQAWANLLKGNVIFVVGKTHKNTERYALREGF